MAIKYQRTTRNSLGQFKRSRESLIHVSAHASMIDNPLAIAAAKAGQPFVGAKLIPYIQKPGMTFDVGRNAAKRAALLASKEG